MQRPDRRLHIRDIRCYCTGISSLAACPVAQAPIYIINLKRSVDRRRLITRQFSRTGFRPLVFCAFDGHDTAFPFFVFKNLSGRWWHYADHFKPGAFACYLSHAAIWAKVASGSSPYAFIFEDDTTFDFAALESCLLDIEDTSFDLIFVNQRMHRWVSSISRTGPSCMVKVASLLSERVLNGAYADHVPCPGADGYIVSKRGARRLLHIMQSRGICMGVDYALLLNTLTRTQLVELSDGSDRLPPSIQDQIHNELVLFSHNAPVALDGFIYAPRHVAKQPVELPSTILHKKLMPNGRFASGFELRHMRWLFLRCLLLYWQFKRNSDGATPHSPNVRM